MCLEGKKPCKIVLHQKQVLNTIIFVGYFLKIITNLEFRNKNRVNVPVVLGWYIFPSSSFGLCMLKTTVIFVMSVCLSLQ